MKVSQKFPLGSSKKQRADFEKVEKGETTKQKGRHLSETSKEDTKSHLNVP